MSLLNYTFTVAYTAYDLTLENQKGRSCFKASGTASPLAVLTESYPAKSSLFHLPRRR